MANLGLIQVTIESTHVKVYSKCFFDNLNTFKIVLCNSIKTTSAKEKLFCICSCQFLLFTQDLNCFSVEQKMVARQIFNLSKLILILENYCVTLIGLHYAMNNVH